MKSFWPPIYDELFYVVGFFLKPYRELQSPIGLWKNTAHTHFVSVKLNWLISKIQAAEKKKKEYRIFHLDTFRITPAHRGASLRASCSRRLRTGAQDRKSTRLNSSHVPTS